MTGQCPACSVEMLLHYHQKELQRLSVMLLLNQHSTLVAARLVVTKPDVTRLVVINHIVVKHFYYPINSLLILERVDCLHAHHVRKLIYLFRYLHYINFKDRWML